MVTTTTEGRRLRYELADPRLAHALGDLRDVVLLKDPQLCSAVNEESRF